MSMVSVGTTVKYAEGWNRIFKKGKTSSKKAVVSKSNGSKKTRRSKKQ